MSADGGRLELPVVAARECAWTASSDATWAEIAPASGQGEATVVVTVAANPQATIRSASITLNGQRTTLAQAPAPCRYTLGSNGTQQPAAGGSASVRLTATSGCSWTATSPVSSVSVNPASGQGAVTVGVRVAANGGAARATQISIGGVPFTVEQGAYVAPAPVPTPPGPTPTPTPSPPAPTPSPGSCSFSIDPLVRTIDDRSRNGDVKVKTTSGCAWTATSNVSWIAISEGRSGTGSGEVRYRVKKTTHCCRESAQSRSPATSSR